MKKFVFVCFAIVASLGCMVNLINGEDEKENVMQGYITRLDSLLPIVMGGPELYKVAMDEGKANLQLLFNSPELTEEEFQHFQNAKMQRNTGLFLLAGMMGQSDESGKKGKQSDDDKAFILLGKLLSLTEETKMGVCFKFTDSQQRQIQFRLPPQEVEFAIRHWMDEKTMENAYQKELIVVDK